MVLSMKTAIKKLLPTEVVDAINRYRAELPLAKHYTPFFKGKSGIEIGGPSIIFRYDIPIYFYVKNLDGVNFSNATVWEGNIAAGDSYDFYYGKGRGKQYVMEASDLSPLQSESYEFLLSSNCLEHVANPLKALKEWVRVVEGGGYILLLLPKKERTFDQRRDVTPFEHLVDDYTNGTTEHDLTHLAEILALHDLSRDPEAGDFENFKARSERNFENRCLHHHVFDADSIRKMSEFVGVSVVRQDVVGVNYIALGQKRS